VVLTLSRCRFVNDSENFSFNVSRQSIRMLKTGRGELICNGPHSTQFRPGPLKGSYRGRVSQGCEAESDATVSVKVVGAALPV